MKLHCKMPCEFNCVYQIFCRYTPIKRSFYIVGTVMRIRKFSCQKETLKVIRIFQNIINITVRILYV